MSSMDDIAAWWRKLDDAATEHDQAIHDAYQHLENAGLISRVAVHRYVCGRTCGPRATVVSLGGTIIVRTKDYKLSSGLNLGMSVEAARMKNTLNGKDWWPAYTMDVSQLVPGGFQVVCRHTVTTIKAADVLAAVKGVIPGRPGKPTIL